MRRSPTAGTATAFAIRLTTAVLLAALTVAAAETVLAARLADRAVAQESAARVSAAAASASTAAVGTTGAGTVAALRVRLAPLADEPEVVEVLAVHRDGSVLVVPSPTSRGRAVGGSPTTAAGGPGSGTSDGAAGAAGTAAGTGTAGGTPAGTAPEGSALGTAGLETVDAVVGDGRVRTFDGSGAHRRTVVVPLELPRERAALVVVLDTGASSARARQLWWLLGAALLLGALALVPMVFLGGARVLVRRYGQALVAGSTDDLTGLGTRRAFRRDLAAHVAQARHRGTGLTLALLDVNGLELVNSTVGRRRGDALIAALGKALGTAIRQVPERRTYRVGGDAFAVVMPGTTLEQAFALTDDLRATIARTAAPLTANVGLSTLDEQRCPDAETLLIAADAALFEARALGGNRVVASGEEGMGLRWVATSGADAGRG